MRRSVNHREDPPAGQRPAKRPSSCKIKEVKQAMPHDVTIPAHQTPGSTPMRSPRKALRRFCLRPRRGGHLEDSASTLDRGQETVGISEEMTIHDLKYFAGTMTARGSQRQRETMARLEPPVDESQFRLSEGSGAA